jgi:hypothetical protein
VSILLERRHSPSVRPPAFISFSCLPVIDRLQYNHVHRQNTSRIRCLVGGSERSNSASAVGAASRQGAAGHLGGRGFRWVKSLGTPFIYSHSAIYLTPSSQPQYVSILLERRHSPSVRPPAFISFSCLPVIDRLHIIMYFVKTPPEFDVWLEGLKDRTPRLRLARRLDKVQRGTLGDVDSGGWGRFRDALSISAPAGGCTISSGAMC